MTMWRERCERELEIELVLCVAYMCIYYMHVSLVCISTCAGV